MNGCRAAGASDRAGVALGSLLREPEVAGAVSRARALDYRVEVADFGEWGTRVRPCAELDRAARCVRIDRRLLLAALARHGPGGAAALAAAAIAHELGHVADPDASESAVRASVAGSAGFDPDRAVRDVLGAAHPS